jgi:hypothetical protein
MPTSRVPDWPRATGKLGQETITLLDSPGPVVGIDMGTCVDALWGMVPSVNRILVIRAFSSDPLPAFLRVTTPPIWFPGEQKSESLRVSRVVPLGAIV